MTLALSQQPNFQVVLLAARDQLTREGIIPFETRLNRLPVRSIPLPAKILHYFWRTLNWPPVDHWCGKSDWVYSPTEIFVSAKNARTAATIHCANWLESNLPWSNTPQNLQARRRMAKVFHPIAKKAHLICTVSQFLKDRIVELLGADPARVAVVGNGVEEEFFNADSASAVSPNEAPYLLAVAPPQLRKGFDFLLRVAEELKAQKIPIRIKVAGTGLPDNMTLGMVRQRHGQEVSSLLGLALAQPNVDLLGYQGRDKLLPLMRQSLALVIFSRYETFGIPAVEAMAAGVPVISAKFAALPEIMGNAALFVDTNSPGETVTVALQFLNDKSKRQKFVQLGLERAKQFTWPRCASRLAAAFQK